MTAIAGLPGAGLLVAELLGLERRLRKIAARADTGQYVGACGNVTRAEVVHDQRSCACACHLGPEYVCDVPEGCGAEYVVLEPEVCTRPLYATRGAGWVRCACGASWDVRARRHQLVRDAEDELAPVAVIAHLAALWIGEPSVAKVENRLKVWVHRQKIKAVTTQVIDGRTRKVYRVGDVLDLLTDTPAKPEVLRLA
jgi:LSD1 subclass zinc finger protein